MVAKSLAILQDLEPRTLRENHHDRVSQITLTILFACMIGVLSSCTSQATEVLLTETPKPSETPAPLPSVTSLPSETETPTPTLNPFGTPIGKIKWPEEGNLSLPVDVQVNFGISLDELQSGSYLLYQDPTTKGLHYSSFDGSMQGMLFAFEPPYSVSTFLRGDITSRVVGLFELGATTRYIVDLSQHRILKLAPLCHEAVGLPSSDGKLMAGICTPRRVQLSGEIVVEVVSLINGESYHLILPFQENMRYMSNRVYWVTDESFIALSGPEEGPCLVSIPDIGMRCESALRGKSILDISQNWLAVRKSEGNARIVEIFPMACFHDEVICVPSTTFEVTGIGSTRFQWSPDGTMLALDEGHNLTSTMVKIGYYDTETWTYHEVGEFSRGYGLLAWCPDSTCMLIVGEPSYLAYLDGRMEQLVFNPDHPLAVIEVP